MDAVLRLLGAYRNFVRNGKGGKYASSSQQSARTYLKQGLGFNHHCSPQMDTLVLGLSN